MNKIDHNNRLHRSLKIFNLYTIGIFKHEKLKITGSHIFSVKHLKLSAAIHFYVKKSENIDRIIMKNSIYTM